MINKDEQEIKKSGYQQQIEDEAQQNITPDKELNRKETEQITNPFYSFHPDVKDPIMARPSMDPSTEKTKAKQEKQASNDYQFKHAESPAMLGATAGAAKGKMDVDANKKERDMNIRRSYLADFVNENGEDIINSEQGKAALSKAKSQEEFTKIFRRLAVDAFKASDHYKEVTEQLNYLNLPYEEKERLREEGFKGGIRSQLEELKSSVKSELDGDPRQSDESKEEYRERARAEYIKEHDGKEPTKKELNNYIRIYKRKGTSFRQEAIETDKQLEENLDKAQQGNWLQRTLGTDLAARTHASKMQTHYGLPETSKLEIADKYIRDSEFLINENDKKDGSKLASAGRAYAKAVFNLETWTRGLTKYLDEDVLNDISAKFDKGEQLTDAEAKLMDALAINLATNLYYDSPNRGSIAGDIAGQSLPFMIEFMFNPLASAGRGIAKLIGRYGLKKFGSKAARRAVRAAGAIAGDAVSAAAMTASTGIFNTANDIGSRYAGDHKFKINPDTGRIEYGGRGEGDDLYTSVLKGGLTQLIEYFSEMGGNRFGEMAGLMGLSKPGKWINNKYSASMIGKAFGKMQGSGVYKTFRELERQAQWSGTFGEYLEEVYGTILNATFVGDEKYSDLLDIDQQVDTFMGLLLSGGAMSGMRTAGYAGDRINTGVKLRALTNDIQNYVGNWDAVKAGIDGMTIAERSWLIKALAGGRNEKVFTDATGRVEGEMSTGEYREMKTQEQNEVRQEQNEVRDVLNFINNEILQGEGLAREGQQQDVSYNKIYEGLNDKLSLGARRKLAEYVSRQTYYEAMTSTARERIEQDREKSREQGVDAFNAAVTDKRATTLSKMQAEYEALVNQGREIQETKNEEGTPINIYDYDGELEKGNITAEEAEVFKNLGDARARMHGAMDQLKKEAQEQVQPLVDFVYEQGMHDSGQVIQVNIGTEEAPKYAFVKKGNLPISEDGNIDYKNADDVVFIVDGDGNQRVMPTNKIRDARAWEKGWMFAQKTYANAYDKIVTPLIEKTEGNAKFEDGEKVEYRDKKGDPHVGTVQNQSDNVVTITDEQGKTQTFTNEELDSSLMGEQVAGVQARDEITVYIDGKAYIANVDHVEGGIAMIEVPDAPDAANRFMSVSEEQLMEMMAQPEPSELDKAFADEQTDAKDEQREDAKGSEEITETSEIAADNETATPSGENNVIDADVEMTETVPTVELPRTKEGDIDYDNIKDDATFIQALEEDFKDTPQDIPEILEDYRKMAEKKVSNAKKRKDPIQRRKAIREAEVEVERWKNLKDAYQQKKLAEQVQQDNSQTLEEAQQREEAARQQRKEEELKAQQEAESVQGVPDMSVDTAEAARNRGFRVQNGIRIDRAQPIEAQNATEQTRKFKDGVEVKVKRTIVEADKLHPSHKGGIVNPMHFITEGQPKDRTDEASKAARTSIATNVTPPEITGGVTAYTGAPVANQRGEIIQGNGRTDGLQEMYKGYPDSAARYKQHLADTASDYGMTAEQVEAMNNPVAVDIVDTSDSEAVRLGQYTASDTESGGVQRISPQHVAVGLGENISNFTSILYNSQNEDMSMGEVVDMNGKKALEYLYNKGLLNDTQYQTAFDSKGNLTPEVKADMQAVTAHVLFNGAPDNLPRMFKALPDKAQKSILQTVHRDLDSEKGDRIIKDIRDAVEAYWHLMQHPEFAEATKYEDTRIIAEQARNQKQMFNSETELPLKKYSNFAMEMAILFKSDTQKGLRQRFNSLFDQLQGKGGSLFEEAVKLPLTEAIKNNFNNIDYVSNREQVQRDNVGADNRESGSRRQERHGDSESGKQDKAGEQPADSGGRTDSAVIDGEGQEPRPTKYVEAREAYDNATNNEERVKAGQKLSEVYAELFGISENRVVVAESTAEFLDTMEMGMKQHLPNQVEREMEKAREYASKGNIIRGVTIGRAIILNTEHLPTAEKFTETWLHEQTHLADDRTFSKKEREAIKVPSLDSHVPALYRKNKKANKFSEAIAHAVQGLLKTHSIEQIAKGNINVEAIHEDIRDITLQTLNKLTNGNSYTDFARRNNENAHGSTKSSSRPVRRKKDTGNERRRPDGPDNADTRRTEPKQQPEVKSKEQQELEDLLKGLADDLGIEDVRFSVEEIASPSTEAIEKVLKINKLLVAQGKVGFEDYARVFINAMGDNIKPYLQGFYLLARGTNPTVEGFNTLSEVEKIDLGKINRQEKASDQLPDTGKKVETKPLSFNRWRHTWKSAHNVSILPYLVGEKFTDAQVEEIKEWAESNGFAINKAKNTVIDIYISKKGMDRLEAEKLLTANNIQKVFDQQIKDEKDKRDAKRQEKKEAAKQRDSHQWIVDNFGEGAMNAYNMNALSDYLEGVTDKFGGMISNGWIDGTKKLDAFTEDGKGVDFKKLKELYDNHVNVKDSAFDLEALKAEGKAKGVTVANITNDGKTLEVGTKSSTTMHDTSKMTDKDIIEEVEFFEDTVERYKRNIPEQKKTISKMPVGTEKAGAETGLRDMERYVDMYENIIIPFYKSNLKEPAPVKRKEGESIIDLAKRAEERNKKKPQTNKQGSLFNNKEQDNDNTKQNEDSNASSKGDRTESGRLSESKPVSDRGLSNESSKGASDSKQIDSGNSSSKSGTGFKYDVNKKYTNDEITEVVSSVAEIKDGKVVITGEVTEDIKQLASHYKSGGVAKKDRGVLDEYYTDGKIVDATTQAMAPLLPKATGLKVLEPSVGTGNFLSAVPAGSDVNTFEINETTARIAKILNPNIEVNVRSFETEFIDDIGNKKPITEQYDVVIGNPPYGSHRGLYKGLGELPRVARYEDYFVKRSLDVMKDGGVLAMVLPSTWMDRHQRPDGYKIENAYRLPSGVFEGTQVGTDIVILRKEKGYKADSDHNYFEANPDKVLGIEKQRKNRFGKMETYVEGDIDNAVSRIKEDMAKAIIDEIGIEPTADNIREAGEVLDETATKEGAKAIIEEEQKAKKKPAPTKKQAPKKSKGKKQPLKITPSQLKYKLNSEDTQVPAAKQFDNAFTEAETAAFRDADYSGMLQNPEAHKEHANYIDGKWMHDFYYAEGNIYSRLEQLEKDKPNMDEAQYEKQKKMLKDVLPEQKTLDQINMTPNTAFVKNLVMGYSGESPISLQQNFKQFVNSLPYEAFGDSGKWEVLGYIDNEQVQGRDKSRNQLIRERRKKVGNRLFNKYLSEELTDAERHKIAYAFNREYNAVYRPDYSKVPMFSSINENFHGRPLKLTEVQLSGIGRMTVKGVGLLAHEVGFGKTLSGILSMHEAMERGFTKKPLLVVPNNSILEQWVQTIEQVIPQSTVNVLGNLGVKYDLTDFEVNDKDITIVTYEGFKKLGFSGETYDKMAQKFSYITEDLDTHKKKNVRDEAKEEASAEEVQGKMMRGGQYSFEGMGFDYMVFDEVHNANHIVSKVRIDRGQHSDFRSQEQRPSDLGIKTWLASQYIQEMNHGRNVLLLSATPFTNKPLEYYSILSLVANSTLERMGFFNVDQFFETFMEADSDFEIKADGTPVQKMNVRRFRNNGLFNQLIGEFIDIKGEEDNPSLVRPDRTNKEYKAPQNELFKQTMERVQVLLSDNDTLLKGLTDARQAAFSPFAASMAPRAPKDHKDFVKNSPKIDTTMRLVEQNLKDNPNGGQIIYSEVGIDFFPMIKEYAVKELKMKDSEVRILSGATSATERAKVQKGFNDGTIKLVIGSPAIKEGMNLQKNTTDMYILSLPYNFTQLRQVEGRGWRQGNKWQNIRINFMLTDDSADVFLLQRLQIKQGLYNEAMKHDHETVDVGDIDTGELKTDLISDPKVRAQLEITQIRERLNAERTQISSDMAFVTRKFEAYKEAEKNIQREQRQVDWVRERAAESPDSYWSKKLPQQEARLEEAIAKLAEEVEKLEKQGVNVKEIEAQKKQSETGIAAIDEQIKQLEQREQDLVAKYTKEALAKEQLQDSVVDEYIAERKKENQSGYYELREDSPLFHVQEQADAVLEFADRLMEPAPQRLWSKDLRQAEYEDRISYSRENGLWVASIDGKPIPNAISDDITRLKETLFGATQTEMDKWKAEYTAKQKGEGKKTTSIGDLIVVDASKQQNATQTSNNYIEMPVKLTTEEARMADISNKIKYSQENGLWVARINGRPIKGASSESIHKLKSDLLDIDTSTMDYHQWRSKYSNEVGQREAREALEKYEKEKDSPINYEPANILSEIILRPKASAQSLDWNSIGETYYVDKPAINIYNLHRSIYKIGNLLRPVRDLKQQGFLNFVGDTGYMNMDRVAEFSDKFEGAISNYAHMLMKTKHMATEAAQREIDLILREIDYAREYYKRLSQDESILREEREPLYHVEENNDNITPNSEENSIFAQNKDNGQANETRLGNRRSMEGSAKRIPLGEQRTSDAVYKTAEASELSGSTSAVQTIEERKELEGKHNYLIKGQDYERKLEEIYGGNRAIGKTIEEASDPEASDRATEENGQSIGQKERLLREIVQRAKSNETWIDNPSTITGSYIGHGQEHEVYLSKDGLFVVKLNNLAFLPDSAENLNDFINRALTQNTLFPQDKFTILGFSHNSRGQVSVVMKQPYVISPREATDAEIDSFLEEHGFTVDIRDVWSDGRYEITDLKTSNVLMDTNGRLRFIDAVAKDVQLEEYLERRDSNEVRFSVEERLYSNLDNIQDEVENYNDVISDVFNNSTQKSKILAAAKADGMKLKEAIENYIAEDATYDEVESVAKALNVGGMADGAVRYMFWRNANPNDGSMVWKAKDALKRRQFEDDILFDKDGPVRDSAMDEYEKKVRGARGLMKAGSWDAIKFGIEEGWMDRMASLRLLQNAIVGEGNPIPDGFNAYRLENQLSSRNLAQVEHYQEKYLDPMIKEANNLFGNDLKEIDRYLIAKHGLERNKYMARQEIEKKSEPLINTLSQQLESGEIDQSKYDKEIAKIEAKNAEKLEEYLVSKDYSGLTALYEDIFGEEAEDVGKYTETVFNAMNQYVQDIENEKDTKPLWNSINKATKYMLKRQYDGGMMSKENYEKVRDMYENYVPLRGFDEVTGSDLYEYMTAKDSNYNRVLKKAHGRKSLSESPFVSLMSMGQSGIMEVNRNNMKKAFYRLVATNPSNIATIKDVWYVKSEDDTWTERHPQIPVDATGDEVASIVEAFEAEMKELFAEDKAKRGRNKLEAGARVTKAQESEHSVKVWVNGEEKVIYVNGNPRAAQALNGLTNSSMREKSGFKRTAQFLMRQMSANFTSRNPEFLITNAQRDMNYAITSAGIKEGPQYAARLGMNATKVGRTIAANIWGNGRKDSKYQKLWDEFVWNGGETGYAVLHSDDTNRKYINKQLRKFSNHKDIFLPFRVWAEQVENANRLIEANTRFAAYVTSREDGRTIERSIADAKDISVNFNRKGSGGYWASTIQDWILFSNPAIQSVRQMGGMAKNHTGRFALALSLAGLGGFMMPIINNLLISMFGDDGDDELYDNLTDWTKYNHMVMYVPGTKDKFISYALSHEMRGFHGLGVLAYEAANGQLRGRNGAQLVLEQFADNLPLDPTGGHSSFMFDAAKPLFEAYITNENFMGIPIYKDNPWNQNAPEWTKAYPRTSPALVDAAKWLNEATGGDEVVAGGININPARIEHVFKGYVGGAWSTYSDAISQVYGAVTGDEESQNIFNAPIARKLIKTSDKYVKERRINSEYRYWQDWMKEYERVQRGYMKIALDHEREDDREKYLQKYLGTFEETPTILYNRIKAISQVIESLEEAGSEQEALEMKAEITDLMWEMQKGD